MAPNPTDALSSVGDSAAQALDDARQLAERLAARAREEAEDMYAEARSLADREPGRDAAVYVGLAAGTVVGALQLPVAAAAGAAYALLRRRRGGR